MEIQLIRNATLRLSFENERILVDPFLAPKHSIQSFVNISPNPLVDLPCTPQEVIAGCGVVIISHLHPDHFDETAQKLLPKDIPIFCQPGDEAQIADMGFQRVTPVVDATTWNGISITRTTGQHGTGEWAERMGRVCGFLLRVAGEPTLYLAGDTIWYEPVARIVKEHGPDVIVTHSGGAKFGDSDPIIMDAEHTLAICTAAPHAKVIAVHLEALDHCTTSRSDLRKLADTHGISPDQLLIPLDGESVSF